MTGRPRTWCIGGTALGRRPGLALVALLAVAACAQGRDEAADEAPAAAAAAGLGAGDIEAPELFQVTDQGLWDGRPSLGGLWVAHPDVAEPQRVVVRNEDNGQSAIGALFRRERANPGPALQVSSDAAAALGMLAGAPATLSVTALRREEPAPDAVEDPADPAPDSAPEALDVAASPDAPADAVPSEPAPIPADTSGDLP